MLDLIAPPALGPDADPHARRIDLSTLLRPTLGEKLDALLLVSPVVVRSQLDPQIEAMERPFGLFGRGLVIRRIKLVDERSITLIAAPSSVLACFDLRAELFALKRAARAAGQPTLMVSGQAIEREPRLKTALFVASCQDLPVCWRDQFAVRRALKAGGGQITLDRLLRLRLRAEDPVACILALVARRVLLLDCLQPIAPDTRIESYRRGLSR